MLKTSAEIKEGIENLGLEAEAFLNVATEEKRELTDSEQKRFDEITDKLIPEQEKALATAEKREKFISDQKAARKIEDRIASGQISVGSDTESSNRIAVPAKAKSHRKLNAYDNERDAYVAGQVCLGGLLNRPAARNWCREHGFLNVQSEGDNTKGGFLVPDEMSRALVRLREERGVFEANANIMPMGSDSMNVPRLLSDVTAYWPGENEEITASDVGIGNAELVARKLACLTRFSTELDEDSVVEVGDMITTSMAYAMADKIDEAGFNGDGTSTYGGVMGLKNALNSSAVQDAATSNDSALELDLADFEATVGLLPRYPGISPAWYVHSQVFYASMARLQQAAGGNTVENLGNGPVMQFMGYPVRFTQVLPSTTGTLASTILAYFGDLRLAATIGRRRGITTKTTEDRYFEYDQIGVQCTQRLAINIHERGDSVRTRPIVALKTAS